MNAQLTTEPTGDPLIDLTTLDPADVTESMFASATAVHPTGQPGRFTAELHPDWSVAGRPNGGYLVSVLGRAATAASGATADERPEDDGDTRTLGILAASTHFLRPPVPGPADVVVEPLHRGKRTSHLRARLVQDGRTHVESMFAIGGLGAEAAAWTGEGPRPTAAPLAECVRLTPDPAVFPVPLLAQVDLRLSPATLGWTQGRPTGRGELTGWLSLPGGAPFDPISLQLAVDAFPPATFDVQMTGWVPTFQLSTYVRSWPAAGPVQVLHRAQVIADDRVDEACFVWDSAGTLVAQSTQLAGIRLR